ncbi:hypothetical protein [Effusibacillus consociatus]|uniref:DUF3147 family protein n=1 Tax=Effusibacillus consociatus TaxID=1117041 RepID=A0ABV9Q2L9_9BACL
MLWPLTLLSLVISILAVAGKSLAALVSLLPVCLFTVFIGYLVISQ